MNRFIKFFSFFFISLSLLMGSALAEPVSEDVSGEVVADGEAVVSPVVPEGDELTLQSVTLYSDNPITAADSSGLKAVLLSLIGDYEATVIDYTYSNSSNYLSHSIEIQPDYVWIASFCMVALMIFCLFKLGGGLCRR